MVFERSVGTRSLIDWGLGPTLPPLSSFSLLTVMEGSFEGSLGIDEDEGDDKKCYICQLPSDIHGEKGGLTRCLGVDILDALQQEVDSYNTIFKLDPSAATRVGILAKGKDGILARQRFK